MDFIDDFKSSLFHINEETFEDSSLALFDFQYHNNQIYKSYCDSIKKPARKVKEFNSIPFLPIEFFKSQSVRSSRKTIQNTFKSSGTTGATRSSHYVTDLDFYHEVCRKIFYDFFGKLENYTLIALLPSYLEQGNSSLISMVNNFMKYSEANSSFFLDREIHQKIESSNNIILFGVSYALLDLPKISTEKKLTVIETGGMKGRKKEITRMELHEVLREKFNVQVIWSEYGMTEIFSQAYGQNGVFKLPGWSSVKIREINDPFSYLVDGKSGGINLIDLANIESCAFIETKDIGIVQKNESFEVLGRFDNSDVRGCNLLV